jgi:DNA polymerase-3 subunit epsilon
MDAVGIASRARPEPLPPRINADERAAHDAFIATLGEKTIWQDYR